MGMSTRITGVRNLNHQFVKMLNAAKALQQAGVKTPPQEMIDYFKDTCDGLHPFESSELLTSEASSVEINVRKTDAKYEDVWEIDLKELPKDVVTIRFTNSY